MSKAQYKRLQKDEFVSATVHNSWNIKPGESPYVEGDIRSGFSFHNDEWELVFDGTTPVLEDILLVNKLTGQRLVVSFTSMRRELEPVYIGPKLDVMFPIWAPDRHMNLNPVEFGPTQYDKKELYVNMGYGIMHRMDIFLLGELEVIDQYVEHIHEELKADRDSIRVNVQHDYINVLRRVRALMGVTSNPVHSLGDGEVTVTPIPLE